MKPQAHLKDRVPLATRSESNYAPDPIQLLSEKELAQATGFSIRTLQGWRCRGGGPPYIRVSPKCIRYRRPVVEAWLEARAQTSTSENEAWP